MISSPSEQIVDRDFNLLSMTVKELHRSYSSLSKQFNILCNDHKQLCKNEFYFKGTFKQT